MVNPPFAPPLLPQGLARKRTPGRRRWGAEHTSVWQPAHRGSKAPYPRAQRRGEPDSARTETNAV